MWSFGGSGNVDGADPQASLVFGTDNNLYGTTNGGGSSDNGTVFKITPSGTETLLHSFSNGNDGANPQAALTLGSDGNFYGTTYSGGNSNNGTIFKITPSGTETVLYSFGSKVNDGANPQAALILGSDGNFYGTTNNGGDYGYGTVFVVTTTGTEAVVYSFGGLLANNDGANPQAGLVLGSDGLYGTTYNGGNENAGTIFKLGF